MTAASIALTKLPFCYNNSPRIAIPLMSPHIGCLHVCVMRNESSTPATCLIHYSELSVQQALHQNLAFMLDSAAPHAIRKSDIIDQSSNSRLFQQTEKKKENRFKLFSPVLSSAVKDNCTFTSSLFWLKLSVIDEGLCLELLGYNIKVEKAIQLPLRIYVWHREIKLTVL